MGKVGINTKRGQIILVSHRVKQNRKVRRLSNIDKPLFCCYCGERIIKSKKASKEKIYPLKGETGDHIPQQCLFEGYDSEFKINRIKVPSCWECNENFAKIENDLRDLIGITNDTNENQIELTKKGVKSIIIQKDWLGRLFFDKNGNVRGVKFDFARLELNHIKNFKGIYYEEFKSIVPQNYKINVINLPLNQEVVNSILFFLEYYGVWKKSGHEDIFRYKIALFKNNNGQIVKTDRVSDSIGVFSLLEYHKSILILVFGVKKRALKSIHTK